MRRNFLSSVRAEKEDAINRPLMWQRPQSIASRCCPTCFSPPFIEERNIDGVLRSSLKAWPQRLVAGDILLYISVVNPIRDLIWRSNSGQRMMLRSNNRWASREMACRC